MPSERFYIDEKLQTGNTITLSGDELHHLNVIRTQVGEEIEVVNGRWTLASARVLTLEKRRASLEILNITTETPTEGLTLALPFLRMSKLEWVIEKATELGASAFLLYPAHHSEKEAFSENQQVRLRSIAIAAMKQCGRLDLPPITSTTLKKIIDSSAPLLFGDPEGIPLHKPTLPVTFVTGPERGFSEQEQALLEKTGKGVRIHKNVLRAETAPIAAVALLGSSLWI